MLPLRAKAEMLGVAKVGFPLLLRREPTFVFRLQSVVFYGILSEDIANCGFMNSRCQEAGPGCAEPLAIAADRRHSAPLRCMNSPTVLNRVGRKRAVFACVNGSSHRAAFGGLSVGTHLQCRRVSSLNGIHRHAGDSTGFRRLMCGFTTSHFAAGTANEQSFFQSESVLPSHRVARHRR